MRAAAMQGTTYILGGNSRSSVLPDMMDQKGVEFQQQTPLVFGKPALIYRLSHNLNSG